MNQPTDMRGVRQRVTTELHPPEPPAPEGVSQLARMTDPTLTEHRASSPGGSRRGGGVQWVRAMDLVQGRGTRLAEMHATGQENLVRRMRHGMARIATHPRHTTSRVAPLPPAPSPTQAPAVQGEAVAA